MTVRLGCNPVSAAARANVHFANWAGAKQRPTCGYVLAVTSGQRLGLRPVTSWIKKLPKRGWQQLSAGGGANGPRRWTGSV